MGGVKDDGGKVAEVSIPSASPAPVAVTAARAVVVAVPADLLAGNDDVELRRMLRVVVAFAPAAAAAGIEDDGGWVFTPTAADPPEVNGEGGRAAMSFHGVHPTHISYTITPRDQ